MSVFDEVEELGEKRNVVYDADGIIYLSCYKYKDTDNIELMYADFFMRIHSIESELWKSYVIDKTVIAITSKNNFRHKLTDRWKADREKKPEKDMTDKQIEASRRAITLRGLVSKVKALLATRLGSSIVVVNSIAEADDTFIDLCNNKDYLGVSMDSDCINQCMSPVFNYHNKHWKWMHEGRTIEEVNRHIIFDTLTGGHNGKFGVSGIGEAKANKILDNGISFSDYVDLFETPEDMLLNVRVASCGQVVDGKVTLLEVKNVSDMFDSIYPF